jgi:hypothetical protein
MWVVLAGTQAMTSNARTNERPTVRIRADTNNPPATVRSLLQTMIALRVAFDQTEHEKNARHD